MLDSHLFGVLSAKSELEPPLAAGRMCLDVIMVVACGFNPTPEIVRNGVELSLKILFCSPWAVNAGPFMSISCEVKVGFFKCWYTKNPIHPIPPVDLNSPEEVAPHTSCSNRSIRTQTRKSRLDVRKSHAGCVGDVISRSVSRFRVVCAGILSGVQGRPTNFHKCTSAGRGEQNPASRLFARRKTSFNIDSGAARALPPRGAWGLLVYIIDADEARQDQKVEITRRHAGGGGDIPDLFFSTVFRSTGSRFSKKKRRSYNLRRDFSGFQAPGRIQTSPPMVACSRPRRPAFNGRKSPVGNLPLEGEQQHFCRICAGKNSANYQNLGMAQYICVMLKLSGLDCEGEDLQWQRRSAGRANMPNQTLHMHWSLFIRNWIEYALQWYQNPKISCHVETLSGKKCSSRRKLKVVNIRRMSAIRGEGRMFKHISLQRGQTDSASTSRCWRWRITRHSVNSQRHEWYWAKLVPNVDVDVSAVHMLSDSVAVSLKRRAAGSFMRYCINEPVSLKRRGSRAGYEFQGCISGKPTRRRGRYGDEGISCSQAFGVTAKPRQHRPRHKSALAAHYQRLCPNWAIRCIELSVVTICHTRMDGGHGTR
ncbi:hypothetical protein C8R43DRAFT_1113208 [Mycena crocata]|nr:hypothetical protein C8R43DRAFT_1113208 [Mycena crocata]